MKQILIAITLLILAESPLNAGYIETSSIIIPWGNSPDQLKFSEPTFNINSPDSSDMYVEHGRGPNKSFVDNNNNIILSSYDFREIKGFMQSGELLFSFTKDDLGNFDEICGEQPSQIYVDSQLHLYILSFPEYPYISVVDYEGKLVEKIYPFADTINTLINSMNWSPDGHVYFNSQNNGWVAYYNGVLTRSGCLGTLASNGFFYTAYHDEDYPHTLFIGKFADVDSFGNPGYKYVKSIELNMGVCDTLYYADEIPGGDGSKVYVLAVIDSCETGYNMIWEYDLDFNLLDQLRFPSDEDPYIDSPGPFIGSDGSIYEFRALDDGLHVIKWTKQ
jgi:hypothetical protein